MVYSKEQYQACKDAAIAEGHSIIESEPDLLLLDYDDAPLDSEFFQQRLCQLTNLFPQAYVKHIYRSKSGEGFHVAIRLGRDVPLLARIALQAAMGSDSVREMLAVLENMDAANPSEEFPPFLVRPKMETMIENIREKAKKQDFLDPNNWTFSDPVVTVTNTTNT